MRKRALLLGVSRFSEFHTLPAAITDVERLSRSLRSLDGAAFDSVDDEIGSSGRVDAALYRRRIEEFLASGASGDLLLLYIATHAIVDTDGTLITLASDFNANLTRSTGVSAAFLGSCINACKASYVLVVLDTCFADAGAWQIFSHRATPFSVDIKTLPTVMLFATTRSTEAAGDGTFAPILEEVITELDPAPGERAVSASRIFDEVSARLAARAAQFARRWELGSGAIPFGRSSPGPLLTAQGVEELYASVEGKSLVRAKDPDVFDYFEISRGRFGMEERIGIKLMSPSTNANREVIYEKIQASIQRLEVQSAIVLVDGSSPTASDAPPPRTTVLTFTDFRRRVQPITAYLEEHIDQYQKSNLFRFGYYVSVRATTEERDRTFILDSHLDTWLDNDADVNQLVVLGDFGTGKTTTARRLLWRQAKRYLDRPHAERIPLFVNLRNYNNIQQLEGLIQRTLNEVRLNSLLTVEDVLRLNDAGRVLWILDGFDEMASKVTPAVAKRNYAELQRLATASARLLLTCRTHFFGTMEQLRETFRFVGNELYAQMRERRYRLIFVQPFTVEDIRQFVTARMRDPELNKGEGALTPEVMLSKLDANAELSDLATRPILAEMVVITLPELVKSDKPINLASLYREYTNNLLDRDAWREVIDNDKLRHQFPQALAWHLFTIGKTELTFEQFPAYVKTFFNDEARSYSDVLELTIAAQTTPLFQRDDEGNYAFAHKSFLEFYTARTVVDELSRGKDDVLEHRLLTAEVLRFASQMVASNGDARKIIEAASSSSRFSLKYFLRRHLRTRFIPVLRKSQITDPVQCAPLHAPLHALAPLALAVAAVTTTVVLKLPIWIKAAAFLGSYAFVFGISFLHYLYLVLRRRVRHPIWRFNVAAIHYTVAKIEFPPPTTDFALRIHGAIADLDPDNAAVAEHTWKAMQGVAAAAAHGERSAEGVLQRPNWVLVVGAMWGPDDMRRNRRDSSGQIADTGMDDRRPRSLVRSRPGFSFREAVPVSFSSLATGNHSPNRGSDLRTSICAGLRRPGPRRFGRLRYISRDNTADVNRNEETGSSARQFARRRSQNGGGHGIRRTCDKSTNTTRYGGGPEDCGFCFTTSVISAACPGKEKNPL